MQTFIPYWMHRRIHEKGFYTKNVLFLFEIRVFLISSASFLKGDVQNCPLCKLNILDTEFTFPAFDVQSMILNQNIIDAELTFPAFDAQSMILNQN